MSEEKTSTIKNPPFPKNYLSEMLVIDSGEGVYLFDKKGKKYLDFSSGISVNALGYGRKDFAKIVSKQMEKLVHVSNLFATEPALALAEKLIKNTGFSAVHFGNSGTEANEAALKYARLYSMRTKGKGNSKILCFENGFHGRTMGALSCTPKDAFQIPFEPLIPGIKVLPYNNSEILRKTIDKSYAGVIVEVVQGEGGLDCMTDDFAKALNKLCRKHDVILIADEIQTGLGRVGYLYASEWVGLEPDIITLAKPLAGGLPLSATLIPEKINCLLKIGDHGTTFGGGPVTTSLGLHILNTISDTQFLKQVANKGKYLKKLLQNLQKNYKIVQEVKGVGLLTGIVIGKDSEKEADICGNIIAQARDKGLLLLCSGKNVIRIAPPLIISGEELEKGVSILEEIIGNY